MLKGIDISNWQAGMSLSYYKGLIDFVCMKATEGINYVDAQCDNFYQQCKKYDYLRGFYHVLTADSAKTQADFFVKSCENYFGDAIPILDVEGISEYYPNDPDEVLVFVNRVKELTGVIPMLYINGSALESKDYSKVAAANVGLWMANYYYGYDTVSWDDVNPETEMYTVSWFDTCAIWQFTSSGKLPYYSGNVDLDLAFMDRDAWGKYCGSKKQEETKPETGNDNEEVSNVSDLIGKKITVQITKID